MLQHSKASVRSQATQHAHAPQDPVPLGLVRGHADHHEEVCGVPRGGQNAMPLYTQQEAQAVDCQDLGPNQPTHIFRRDPEFMKVSAFWVAIPVSVLTDRQMCAAGVSGKQRLKGHKNGSPPSLLPLFALQSKSSTLMGK